MNEIELKVGEGIFAWTDEYHGIGSTSWGRDKDTGVELFFYSEMTPEFFPEIDSNTDNTLLHEAMRTKGAMGTPKLGKFDTVMQQGFWPPFDKLQKFDKLALNILYNRLPLHKFDNENNIITDNDSNYDADKLADYLVYLDQFKRKEINYNNTELVVTPALLKHNTDNNIINKATYNNALRAINKFKNINPENIIMIEVNDNGNLERKLSNIRKIEIN